MYQYRLYNSEDIEKLKKDLTIYQQTVRTLKSEKVFEIQRELYDLRIETSTLKGEMRVMEDRYEEKINEYERHANNISSQIEIINDSLNELKQDVKSIKGEVKEIRFTDLLEKMNYVINKTDENLSKVKNEIKSQEAKTHKNNEHKITNTSNTPTNQKVSEYRQLQNMLQSYNVRQVSNQKKNKTSNSKTIMKKPIQSYRNTKSFGDIQSNITINSGKKSFRNSQYEINKNIITNISTKNNVKAKENNNPDKGTSLTVDEDRQTPPLLSENQPTEESLVNFPITNISETDKETNHLLKSEETIHSNETLSKQKSEKEMEHTEKQNIKSNNKRDSLSFFSLFRKG